MAQGLIVCNVQSWSMEQAGYGFTHAYRPSIVGSETREPQALAARVARKQ